MPRNIYIIGVQSSGKTTLVTALERHFIDHGCKAAGIAEPEIISEVVREVFAKQGLVGADILQSRPKALEMQKMILDAQREAEQAIKSGWFIADRSAVDALVYARRYAGPECAEKLKAATAWQESQAMLRNSLIVICEPVAAWLVPDGLRLALDESESQSFHDFFLEVLGDLGLNHTVLPGTIKNINERVDFVVNKWRILSDTGLDVVDESGTGHFESSSTGMTIRP